MVAAQSKETERARLKAKRLEEQRAAAAATRQAGEEKKKKPAKSPKAAKVRGPRCVGWMRWPLPAVCFSAWFGADFRLWLAGKGAAGC